MGRLWINPLDTPRGDTRTRFPLQPIMVNWTSILSFKTGDNLQVFNLRPLPRPIPRRRQPFVSAAGTERADAGRADRCIDVGGDYAVTSFEVLYEQGRSASEFGLGAHLLARQGSLLGRDWDAEIGP